MKAVNLKSGHVTRHGRIDKVILTCGHRAILGRTTGGLTVKQDNFRKLSLMRQEQFAVEAERNCYDDSPESVVALIGGVTLTFQPDQEVELV